MLDYVLRDRVWIVHGRCIPKVASPRTINMYLGLLRKTTTTTFTTNQSRRIATPLFRGFLPGKRHAAQIASRDLGSICLFVTFGVARTEAFLMASDTFIIDVFGLTRCPKHLAALTPILGVRAAPCLIFT